jgi:pyridoxine/pyridoxamine 5'-phosphate oxidase
VPQPNKAKTPAKKGIRASLPQMPAMYGLKPRKQYLPWSHAEERLSKARNYWVCTSRPDGRPHSIPVWGHWADGALYFGTARQSCKGRNLANNPAVSIHLESGDDVIILEGTAVEVDDKPTVKKINAAYKNKYATPLLVIPGETVLYRVRPRVAFAWSEKDFLTDATRWNFPAE